MESRKRSMVKSIDWRLVGVIILIPLADVSLETVENYPKFRKKNHQRSDSEKLGYESLCLHLHSLQTDC